MRYLILFFFAVLAVKSAANVQSQPQSRSQIQLDSCTEALSDNAASLAQAQQAVGVALADKLLGLAELGYKEYQSSAELLSYLGAKRFSVETNAGAIPTALVATYRSP